MVITSEVSHRRLWHLHLCYFINWLTIPHERGSGINTAPATTDTPGKPPSATWHWIMKTQEFRKPYSLWDSRRSQTQLDNSPSSPISRPLPAPWGWRHHGRALAIKSRGPLSKRRALLASHSRVRLRAGVQSIDCFPVFPSKIDSQKTIVPDWLTEDHVTLLQAIIHVQLHRNTVSCLGKF